MHTALLAASRPDPKYRQYRPKNLAVGRIDGRDFYLGRFDSPESWWCPTHIAPGLGGVPHSLHWGFVNEMSALLDHDQRGVSGL